MQTDKLIGSYQDLLQLLTQDGVLHQPNVQAQEVLIPTHKGILDSVMVVRWQQAEGVMQFIQPMPIEIPQERMPAVENAVARVNHVLAIPGFDISHEVRRLAFRCTMAVQPRGRVSPDEIQSYFRLAVRTAADFIPAFGRIARGESGPETIVSDVKKDLANEEKPSPEVLNLY